MPDLEGIWKPPSARKWGFTSANTHTGLLHVWFKETKSATMNTFRFFFLFKSFVKVELSYAFTINMFTIAENCTEK